MALPSTTNMRWYYDGDEASGQCDDKHSGGYHLTDNNTVGQADGPEAGSKARLFTEANSEFLSYAEADVFNDMGDIDCYSCAWLYFNTIDTSGYQHLWGAWQTSGNDRVWAAYQNDSDIRAFISNDGSAFPSVFSSSLSTGTWYFVEWHHDAANNTLGVAASAASGSLASWTTTSHTTGLYAPTGSDRAPFYVGGSPSHSDRYFNGRWCRCGFWDEIPTTAERTSLFNGGDGVTYSDFSGGPAATTNASSSINVVARDRRLARPRRGILVPDTRILGPDGRPAVRPAA